jgi:hypothetical protein
LAFDLAVLARSLAYEGNSAEIADVLDVAEYLPMLMLEPTDRTAEFREQLAGLAAKRPKFTLAVGAVEPPVDISALQSYSSTARMVTRKRSPAGGLLVSS